MASHLGHIRAAPRSQHFRAAWAKGHDQRRGALRLQSPSTLTFFAPFFPMALHSVWPLSPLFLFLFLFLSRRGRHSIRPPKFPKAVPLEIGVYYRIGSVPNGIYIHPSTVNSQSKFVFRVSETKRHCFVEVQGAKKSWCFSSLKQQSRS